jgi:hypothetical protein
MNATAMMMTSSTRKTHKIAGLRCWSLMSQTASASPLRGVPADPMVLWCDIMTTSFFRV